MRRKRAPFLVGLVFGTTITVPALFALRYGGDSRPMMSVVPPEGASTSAGLLTAGQAIKRIQDFQIVAESKLAQASQWFDTINGETTAYDGPVSYGQYAAWGCTVATDDSAASLIAVTWTATLLSSTGWMVTATCPYASAQFPMVWSVDGETLAVDELP